MKTQTIITTLAAAGVALAAAGIVSAEPALPDEPLVTVEHEHSTDRLWNVDDEWIVEVHSHDAARLDTFTYDDVETALENMGAEECAEEDGHGQTFCHWDAETRGNGKGESLVVNGDEAATIEREAVTTLPAPTPTPTAEPVASETPTPVVETPTPVVESTPESLCDPEITDLHCDPETGEYYDDPPMECIPEGFLSPGAVAPVGVPMCED